jgi:hypothetical protein
LVITILEKRKTGIKYNNSFLCEYIERGLHPQSKRNITRNCTTIAISITASIGDRHCHTDHRIPNRLWALESVSTHEEDLLFVALTEYP